MTQLAPKRNWFQVSLRVGVTIKQGRGCRSSEEFARSLLSVANWRIVTARGGRERAKLSPAASPRMGAKPPPNTLACCTGDTTMAASWIGCLNGEEGAVQERKASPLQALCHKQACQTCQEQTFQVHGDCESESVLKDLVSGAACRARKLYFLNPDDQATSAHVRSKPIPGPPRGAERVRSSARET